MERMGFPGYLRRIIDSYLRTVEFPTCDGDVHSRAMTAGVPQGSVLGPLLWNIAYNYAIEMRPRSSCEIVAYADDTMVLAAGPTVEVARARINDQLVPVLRRLEALGLKVVPSKTKAILFRGRRRLIGLPVLVRVEREYIRTSNTMKYLGVMLDHRLSFGAHFAYVVTRSRACPVACVG